MNDNQKTLVAAGALAAAVGVYVEISHLEDLKTEERRRESSGMASASASTAPPHIRRLPPSR